jgi:hypothetical protein
MSPADWFVLMIGALLAGLGKGGLVGVGNLTVLLFAMVLEPKASVGVLLPVLISADIVAIIVYRRHADWRYLGLLLPWMAGGILLGYFLFSKIDGVLLGRLIGAVVLAMTLLQVGRRWLQRKGTGDFADRLPHTLIFRSGLGLLGGFASMVANAAGPIGQLYFISVGLPKLAFIGTGAWCFFIVNLIKLPFQAHLGLVYVGSLQLSLSLAPVAMLGTWLGPRILHLIPQRVFTPMVWSVILIVAIKLLLF